MKELDMDSIDPTTTRYEAFNIYDGMIRVKTGLTDPNDMVFLRIDTWLDFIFDMILAEGF